MITSILDNKTDKYNEFCFIIEIINKLLLRQIDNIITKNQDKYKIIINNF